MKEFPVDKTTKDFMILTSHFQKHPLNDHSTCTHELGTMEAATSFLTTTRGSIIYSKDPFDYICHICPEKSKNPLEDHLKDENHLSRLQFYNQCFTEKEGIVHCVSCFKKIDLTQVIEHAISHKLIPWYVPDNSSEILFKNFISKQGHEYFCHLCKVKISFWHLVEFHSEDSHHQGLKRDKIDEVILQELSFTVSQYQFAIDNSIFMTSSKTLFCVLCQCKVENYEKIGNHVGEKCHMENIDNLEKAVIYPFKRENTDCKSAGDTGNIQQLPEGITKIQKNEFMCKICQLKITGYKRIFEHTEGKKHLKKLEKEQITNKVSSKENGEMINVNNKFSDFLNEKIISRKISDFTINNKKERNNFEKLKQDLPEGLIILENQKQFWCILCYVAEPLENAAAHASGETHRIKSSTWLKPPNGENTKIPSESPKKAVPPHKSRINPLDIPLENSLNIYEPNKQMIKDLEISVLLSFSINHDIYCLSCRKPSRNSLQHFYEHLRSKFHSENFRKMIENHEKSPGHWSDLVFAHEYMERFPGYGVKCHACRVSITHDYIILHHMNDPSHVEKRSFLRTKSMQLFKTLYSRIKPDFYNSRKYWCVPCGIEYSIEIEFLEHLNTEKHEKKIKTFENKITMFDYCGICTTLWYGFPRTFHYHSNDRLHSDQVYNNFYPVDKIRHPGERRLQRTDGEVQEIVLDIENHEVYDKDKEDQVMRDLERISKNVYPGVKAYPFGSRVTGAGGKDSDLDIFLDCPTETSPVYSGENSSREEVLTRLGNIKKCLDGDVDTWFINNVIKSCRIPIIRVTHKPTGIKCDLSFTSGLAVENTRMIKAYCESYPDCRRLIVFVKGWMRHCEINKVHGFSSYGIAWLVIYFLQVKMILPTISELIERRGESRVIGGWETGVCNDFKSCGHGEHFRELVIQFFEFYGRYDYRNQVICPLLGRSVEKRDFQRPEVLLPIMKNYLDFIEGKDESERFRVDSVLCLQDPFELAHNLCRIVKKFTVCRFKTLCCLSARALGDDVEGFGGREKGRDFNSIEGIQRIFRALMRYDWAQM